MEAFAHVNKLFSFHKRCPLIKDKVNLETNSYLFTYQIYLSVLSVLGTLQGVGAIQMKNRDGPCNDGSSNLMQETGNTCR